VPQRKELPNWSSDWNYNWANFLGRVSVRIIDLSPYWKYDTYKRKSGSIKDDTVFQLSMVYFKEG
jgi:hypothetical protein